MCRELVQSGKDIEAAYWELVVKDIQDACKLFEPIYNQTNAGDGYVSVEVSPRLADDTEGTVEAAKWLHKVVDRPNVYIKIPATAPCIPSIQKVISHGISVNVTVSSSTLFFLPAFEDFYFFLINPAFEDSLQLIMHAYFCGFQLDGANVRVIVIPLAVSLTNLFCFK